LPEGQIFHDMSGDGLPDLARRGFDAGKGRLFTGEVVGLEMDAKFFGDFVQDLLIFGRPGAVEHGFILELRTEGKVWNNAQSLTQVMNISY
jgi:hypothetical protein